MKDQLKTVREFVESVHEGEWLSHVNRDKTLTALAQLEAMVGEPVARYNWHTAKLEWLVPYKAEFNMKPLYFATPVAQQYEAGGIASAAAQGFRDGVASVTQQEPQRCDDCGDTVPKRKCYCRAGCVHEAAPVAQQPPIRALGAPSRTEWGFGMVCIDIELGKDSTATVFFDLDDTEKVERRFGVEIKRD